MHLCVLSALYLDTVALWHPVFAGMPYLLEEDTNRNQGMPAQYGVPTK